MLSNHSPSPGLDLRSRSGYFGGAGCPVRPSSVAVLLRRVGKHGDEWLKATAAQPLGRSRVYLAIALRRLVASAQFRLAFPQMPRAEARGASLEAS